MLLLKLGGSLFSPKHQQSYIDTEYLQRFFSFFKDFFTQEQTILLHGTGNIGHGFVEKYGLDTTTFSLGKKMLGDLFSTVDTYFPHFMRYEAENILSSPHFSFTGNCISGGDIASNLSIISSDDLFSFFLHSYLPKTSFLLTDVDGVFDTQNNIISEITKASLSTIHFWKKQGDVTGAMDQKIKKLFEFPDSSGIDGEKVVWICNGNNFENIKDILTTGTGVGTRIIL